MTAADVIAKALKGRIDRMKSATKKSTKSSSQSPAKKSKSSPAKKSKSSK